MLLPARMDGRADGRLKKELTMTSHAPHKPRHPGHTDPDDFEPVLLPVEPDAGPVPPVIPDDPEHEMTPDHGL